MLLAFCSPSYMDGESEPKKKPGEDQGAWWLQPVRDGRSLLAVLTDPPRRRCLLSSCSFMACTPPTPGPFARKSPDD